MYVAILEYVLVLSSTLEAIDVWQTRVPLELRCLRRSVV